MKAAIPPLAGRLARTILPRLGGLATTPQGEALAMLDPSCGPLDTPRPDDPNQLYGRCAAYLAWMADRYLRVPYELKQGDIIHGQDFLTTPPEPRFDIIFTNPPYSMAEEFVRRSFEWRRSPQSLVVMLLSTGFLGAQCRGAWLRDNTPSLLITPRRPSFTGEGSDSSTYAWCVWGDSQPVVEILPTELPVEQRGPRRALRSEPELPGLGETP